VLLPYLVIVKYVFKKSSCSRTAWTNYQACKIQPLKIVVKSAHLMMWTLCKSLTRRTAEATHRWTHCTQLPQQRRKTPHQNAFAHHQRSVTVSVDVSWQVKIGLRQFDNYLSQVKINVKQLTTAILKISGEFFVFQQESPRHTVRQFAFLSVT